MKCPVVVAVATVCLFWGLNALAHSQELKETLPAIQNDIAPSNFDEMWAGFDPRAEPLETEIIKQWEDDGVVLQVVRFRIGVFKGKVAKLAAIYGYPKSIKANQKIPGLLQIHGGGQYADQKAVITNAKRGYATVSIAWAGRISAKDYLVRPETVKLFWDQKTDDPKFKLTTDWGSVDAYHAPCRNPGTNFPSAKPTQWTVDSIESPRNSPWYLCALAGRRALTFLEQQPQVDGEKLGVYGHSMGGKLTVMVASDERVKAAAPSCGGISDRDNKSELFRNTIGDDSNLRQISCPIAFLSPSNDFHGRICDLPQSIDEVSSPHWRLTCSPHRSHQDEGEYAIVGLLWFDQHLKGEFECPQTPVTRLDLKFDDGVPVFHVHPDSGKAIRSVDVFYTQNGKQKETSSDREITKNRFWHHAKPTKQSGDHWSAKIPVVNVDKPLWVYANVEYELDQPTSGAGYYYRVYTANSFQLSSLLKVVAPETLKGSGVKATRKPSLLIEDFQGQWDKQWYPLSSGHWKRATHKVFDETYSAPQGDDVKLALQVQASQENKLLLLVDGNVAEIDIKGDGNWQDIQLSLSELKDFDGNALKTWAGIKTLSLSDSEHLRGKQRDQRKVVGKAWSGEPPKFRELRWVVGEAKKKDSTEARVGSSNAVTPIRKPETFVAAADKAILDVFPQSTADVEPDLKGQAKLNDTFTPSKSLWTEGLDETKVFHGEMIHEQAQGNSYSLRIGKGGQVYSLRGSFGESVPPSWRDNSRGRQHQSPWNDEVWQFVAVCTKHNGLDNAKKAGDIPKETLKRINESGYANAFFVHNSGAYIPNDADLNSLYCPMLSSQIDQVGRSFRVLNWGLVPQIKTIHRSPILFYTQVRDVGDGVIELTWVVHNFSVQEDVVFDHLNAPWGGTRVSSLPFRFVTAPDGSLVERKNILSKLGVVPVEKTAGWNISCATEASDSPSLALVYGRDKHLQSELAKKAQGKPYAQFKHSLYRDWRASEQAYKTVWKDWQTRPANSFRNYDVCEVIPKLRIAPGTSIWYRSFLVVGPKNKVVKRASDMVQHVDYGLLQFDSEATAKVSVSISDEKIAVTSAPDVQAKNSAKEFSIFARPVSGTKPLFLIENAKTDQQVVTTDPYLFVPQEKLDLQFPKDHSFSKYYRDATGYSLGASNSRWKGLLGFGYEKKPEGGNWVQISSLLDQSRFPTANKYHLDLWVEVPR